MARQRLTERRSVTWESRRMVVKQKFVSPMSMAVNVPARSDAVFNRLLKCAKMPTTWKEALKLLADVKYVRYRPGK
jgi:hypothetical protein